MKFRKSYLLMSTLFVLSACKGNSNQAAAPTEAAPAAASANPVDPATAGNITGSVKFTGTKPKAQKITMGADAYCKTTHTTDTFSEDVIVNANNTLKNVFVYVKSGLTVKFPAPTEAVIFDQKGCLYTPHVAFVQVGQPLKIRNSDGVLHNVNVRPAKNAGFNMGQPVQGMESDKSFAIAEIGIPAKCDVHPWMHAWINVLDNPYGAVSSDDGSFALNNLPPGEYEIEAWHEKYGAATQKVTVGAKESKKIEFTFKGA